MTPVMQVATVQRMLYQHAVGQTVSCYCSQHAVGQTVSCYCSQDVPQCTHTFSLKEWHNLEAVWDKPRLMRHSQVVWYIHE